jgi:hypothetical protein
LKKRILAILLSIVLGISMLPISALAIALEIDDTRDYWKENKTISLKEYAIAPDIVEYEWITNSNAMNAQQFGHVMEVKLGENAQIIAGYNNYLKEDHTIDWGMKQATAQGAAAETARGVNVVGAVNGDFYNMSNGSPTGALVMNGTVIKTSGNSTFWIDKSGVPHITAGSEVDWGNVQEAIGGGVFLLQDGEIAPDAAGSQYGEAKNPRTVVGLKPDHTVVIYMVDGRQAPLSVGMVYQELAEIMLALGCEVAINLDGGGSSTFATQREGEYGGMYDEKPAGLTVRCSPSDGYERLVSSSLLVVSNAAQTGIFDHASIEPKEEVYTPGSRIQFTATGVDTGGYAVDLPGGLVWEVVESGKGSIDENGLFTSVAEETGTLTVQLKDGEKVVGSTQVELQWPDELGFTNSSISLDYGESSDLSFYPTWQGREVHYKDGDFEWGISSENLNFRYSTPVEKYYYPHWVSGVKWIQIQLMLTGAIGETKTITDGTDACTYYETKYEETSLTVKNEGGHITAEEVVTHKGASSSDNAGIIQGKEDIRADTTVSPSGGTANDGQAGDVIGLSALFPESSGYTHTYSISLGSFAQNQFTADEDNSLRGTIVVELAGDSTVAGAVDIIVGMEPHVLMDFEDKGEVAAEDYWRYVIGKGNGLANNYLSKAEVQENLLWYRNPTGAGGDAALNPEETGLISDAEMAKYGEHAFKLGFNYRGADVGTNMASGFGFSGDLLLDTIQPTKLGAWIYVPDMGSAEANQTTYGNLVLKAVAKAYNGTSKNTDVTSHLAIDEETGAVTRLDGELNGTTSYLAYSYNQYDGSGNVVKSMEKLSEMAGLGWIWVEADISKMQMPVDLCRAYTIRIVSPVLSDGSDRSNGYEGAIYIDNVQLIYGSNTDDVINPVVDEPTLIAGAEPYVWGGSQDVPQINMNNTSVEFTYSDAVGPDQAKYNTGIDVGSVKVLLDGSIDMTEKAVVNAGNAIIPLAGLTNGRHSIALSVKDKAGNRATITRSFTVALDSGTQSAIQVQSSDSAVVGGNYAIQFVNRAQATSAMSFKLLLPMNRYTVTPGTGYGITEQSYNDQSKTLTVSVEAEDGAELVDGSLAATVEVSIPADAVKGDKLEYSVTSGSYILGGQSNTFTDAGKSIPLTAAYTIQSKTEERPYAVQGFTTEFTVLDSATGAAVEGASVYVDGVLAGATDAEGRYTHQAWEQAGAVIVYAQKGVGRSWSENVVVNSAPADVPGQTQHSAPIKGDGSSGLTVTWLSPLGSTLADGPAALTLSREADLSEGVVERGESLVKAFSMGGEGTVLRVNTVNLTGLEADTEYYYQVDGDSVIHSFTTSPAGPDRTVHFFVMADTQGNYGSGTTLDTAVNNLAKGEIPYDFGIHTGDAIDNPNVYSNWTSYFETLNSSALDGIPIAHVLGNHEYGEATGQLAGSIFGLGDSCQGGSFYSVEYGSVYVAVINDSLSGPTALYSALDQLVASAKASTCAWKVLAMHKPVFGTEGIMSDATLKVFLSKIQEAGIHLVFTGDNHAYARTYPVVYDAETESFTATADNESGTVYFVCGDLSAKSNEFHDSDYFAKAIAHVDYTAGDADGAYLSVKAEPAALTVTACDQNGALLDSYRIAKSGCEIGQHTLNSDSRYDPASGMVSCGICGAEISAEESGYTGLLSDTEGGQVVLSAGVPQKDAFTPFGKELYHSDHNGKAHLAEMLDPRTCLTGGAISYSCTLCGVKEEGVGDYLMPEGHTWATDGDHGYLLNENGNRTCTLCGAEGRDIAEAIVDFGTVDNPRGGSTIPRYSYLTGGVRPSSFVSFDGKTALSSSNDNTLLNGRMRDLYVSWLDSTSVGAATIRYEGRGNYYGTRTLTYHIVPGSVKTLSADLETKSSVQLSWTAAAGAEYYEVYACDAANTKREWKARTSDTSCVIDGLVPETDYYFVVAGRAYGPNEAGESQLFTSGNWSNVLAVSTSVDETLLSATYIEKLSATIDGMTVQTQAVNGTQYLFLPAAADLEALPLAAVVKEDREEPVTLSGDRGSVTLSGESTPIHMPSLATADESGAYTLAVTLGELKPFTLRVMVSHSIGTVYLTSGSADQGRDYVDADKSNAVSNASMRLTGADGVVIYDGGLKQLKARGNSTFTYTDKKSYQIKLAAGTDLLGTGEPVKTWVLLANYFDATQMHDKLFKDLAADLGMPYTASCNWVDLFYDGEYRGTYLLSEKVSVGATSVDVTDMESLYQEQNETYGENMAVAAGVNAYGQTFYYTEGLIEPSDLTGGYLIELNADGIDEASGFLTGRGKTFNVKSPEWAGRDAMAYISEYYQAFEDAVYAVDGAGNHTGYNEATGKYYYDYCDLNSLVQAFAIQELALNPDGFRSSLFFYKDAGEIMYAGPIWDMDNTLGTGWEQRVDAEALDYHYLADALIQIPEFKAALVQYLKETLLPKAEELLASSGEIDRYENLLSASAEMNYVLWPYVRISNPNAEGHLWQDGTTHPEVIADMEQWLSTRISVLKKRFGLGGSSGGSSGGGIGPVVPSYPISVSSGIEHGTITVSPKSAGEGDTVTITVKPDSGYQLDRLTVRDKNGKELKLTEKDGKYTFTMPDSQVAVEAVFTADGKPSASPFTDVAQSDYFYDAVLWAVGKGITTGTSSTTFAPATPCTRGEMVTFLWRAAGAPSPQKTAAPFTDVKSGVYYYEAVLWAVEQGVTKGTSATTFEPDAVVTRGQTVTFLHRAEGMPAVQGAESFDDVLEDAYYAAAVKWAAANGVTNGAGDNAFLPDRSCTRGEIVTFLYRAMAE